MPDDAQNILSPLQVDNSIKANAWEAFNSAKNENELGVRLQGINLPQDAKARLWEAKKSSAIQIPDPVAQAQAFTRSQIKPLIPGTGTIDPTGGFAEAQKSPEYQGYMKASGQMAAGAAGGMAGGALAAPLLPGAQAAGGGGALSWLLPKLASTSAMGFGGGAGALTQGATPKEALEASAKGTVAGMALEGGSAGVKKSWGAGAKQVAKLSGETPERIAALKALPQQEAAINQKITQAEVQSRAAFKAAYPKIDESPVNLQETRAVAQQATEQLKAYPSPRTLSQVSDIPMPTEAQVARQIAPETWHPETILDRLGKFDNVPFREAQQYRTAIEQYISKARPPAPVYNALKNVSNSLESGLETTATREGVLPQYQNGNALFKQHAADFWNKGAPLKPFASIPPDATGATVNKFLQTAQQGRALEALERRLGPQPDLRAILAKGPKAVKADFRDAATLKNLGEPALNQQVAPRNRMAALKLAGALGLSGGGLFELYRALKGNKP